MGLDMAKYRRIFLEESADHLAEISRALLDLEKGMDNVEAIDTIFRMAHSIKSMAASLGYDPVADLSHRMEDRMEGVRASGRVRDPHELSLLFRSLEALEAMVETVSNEAELTPADPALLADLAAASATQEAAGAIELESAPEASRSASATSPAALDPDPVGGEPKKVRS